MRILTSYQTGILFYSDLGIVHLITKSLEVLSASSSSAVWLVLEDLRSMLDASDAI